MEIPIHRKAVVILKWGPVPIVQCQWSNTPGGGQISYTSILILRPTQNHVKIICSTLHDIYHQFTADGTDIIFYRAGGTTVKIFHYQSNDKPDTYALYGKKQARKRVVRFAVTPSKNLVCYHFVPPVPTTENPAPSLDVTIDIVDIQTTSKIHSFKKQDCGAFLGNYKQK